MAIGWQGRAIWPTEGKEDSGQNLELELKVTTGERARARAWAGAKHEHNQVLKQAPESVLRKSSARATAQA